MILECYILTDKMYYFLLISDFIMFLTYKIS